MDAATERGESAAAEVVMESEASTILMQSTEDITADGADINNCFYGELVLLG